MKKYIVLSIIILSLIILLTVIACSQRENNILEQNAKHKDTVLKIDKDTCVYLQKLESTNKKNLSPKEKYKTYKGEISQLILSKSGKEYVIWSEQNIFSDPPIVGDRKNYKSVPLYDVIVKNDLNEIRIIYQISTLLEIDIVDISDINNPQVKKYPICRTALQEYDMSIRHAVFAEPDKIRIENESNSVLCYSVDSNNKDLSVDLLWWNGKGPKFMIEREKQSKKLKNYMEGVDEPTYDKSVWNDWYQMGYDYSSGKKEKLNN